MQYRQDQPDEILNIVNLFTNSKIQSLSELLMPI